MASSLAPTFIAALRAVGTAATMAGAGFYLHRRDFVTPSGKKMLALISQQVTIPAFLFAKIIYCPNGTIGGGGGSEGGGSDVSGELIIDDTPEIVCPTVADRISNLWMLLLWPGYVVLCGLFTGYVAAKISNTSSLQTRSCLAACAFGNSTGLPITLLTVIHNQMKQLNKSTDLGRIDPTAFLSVYLLLYPVLQWGAGGWLLAPEDKAEKNNDGLPTDKEDRRNGIEEARPLLNHQDTYQANNLSENDHSDCHHTRHISHILNYEPSLLPPSMAAGQEEFGGVRSRRLFLQNKERDENQRWDTAGSVEASNDHLSMMQMVRELSFGSVGHRGSYEEMPFTEMIGSAPEPETGSDEGPLTMDAVGPASDALSNIVDDMSTPTIHEHSSFSNGFASASPNTTKEKNGSYDSINMVPSRQQIETLQKADILPLTETLSRISRKVFQPPVIGALLGLSIAGFPGTRGLFENIWGDKGKTAPLHFIFDGIYKVGQAAVPLNMIILGINFSSTFRTKNSEKTADKDQMTLSNKTMLAVVVGKMIVMPVIGMLSCWVLERSHYINFPDEIDATCYLVMMIVFITPTANNVMVMVELSGSSSKEGMARLIGWQYAVSPVVLSIVLSAVVILARCHFDSSPSPVCQK